MNDTELAVTLQGTIYVATCTEHQVRAGARIQEGQYTGDLDGFTTVPSKDECPYCRTAMIELCSTQRRRIVRVLEHRSPTQAVVIGCETPAHLRVIACSTCRVVFTAPKTVES